MIKKSVIKTLQDKLNKANENITYFERFLSLRPFELSVEQKEVATSSLKREKDKKELIESKIELLGGTE